MRGYTVYIPSVRLALCRALGERLWALGDGCRDRQMFRVDRAISVVLAVVVVVVVFVVVLVAGAALSISHLMPISGILSPRDFVPGFQYCFSTARVAWSHMG